MRLFVSFTIFLFFSSVYLFAQVPTDGEFVPANLVKVAEQTGETFDAVEAFVPSKSYASIQDHPVVSKALPRGTFLEVAPNLKEDLMEAGEYAFSMEIPTTEGVKTLKLVQVKLFKDGMKVRTSTLGDQQVDLGLHYRGVIEGEPNSLAAISVFDGEVAGFFSSDAVKGNYIIGKLKEADSETHIVYNDADLRTVKSFGCATVYDGIPYEAAELLPAATPEDLSDCVDVYVEVNFNTYQNQSSNVQTTTNYITNLFNQSITLYANENINMEVSDIFIWTASSPYSGGSSTMLSQFQSQTSSINGDIGHLISYSSSGAGGIAAGFAGICNSNVDNSLCVTQTTTAFNTVPTYSRSVKVVTHEMGHLLGSRHTHACVWNGNGTAIDGCALATEGSCSVPSIPPGFEGTIMSYCDSRGTAPINFNLGFGPQPGNVIRNSVANGNCLNPCGAAPPTACSSIISSFPYAEGFESGLGAWTQGSGDDFDWTRNSGTTISNGTGPSGAAAGTWYMYMEVSSPNYPSRDAYLNSPCFNLTGISNPSIAFQYHALGGSVGTLRLQASTDGANWTTIWSFTGDQGSAWTDANVSLNAYTNESELRLRFYGTSGSSWQGDMCIDDILVSGGAVACPTTITSFPYNEGFESGLGAWTQGSGDDFDWTRNSGTTLSSGTGPSGAAAGTWYVYVETSTPNYPTKTALLNSPCFNLSGLSSPEVSFQYHMLGGSVGTLSLLASIDGASWTPIWSASGDQGSAWLTGTVDLSSYAGESAFRLRFNGTSSSSWQGDLCVDDIFISEAVASCPTINFNDYTVTAYGSGQDAGSSAIQDGGATLFLQNNAWKDISYPYTVTSSTVIEFDFRSTLQGEIHGIGFDTDEAISSNLTFKVHGTQNWGITNYDNYSGSSWTTYTIPVGSFYTGSFSKLFFVADHDGSPQNGNAYFRNVKVYENSCGDPGMLNEVVTSISYGSEREFFTKVFPNPFESSFSVVLPKMKIPGQEARVSMYSTVGRLLFQQQYMANGQTIEIGPDVPAGIYLISVEAGDFKEELKVIKAE